MSITLDPTVPANTEAQGGGLGSSRIRNITTWVLQLLGQSGAAPVTYSLPPFPTVDIGTGLVQVQADPTASLGIATKHYVDNALGTGIPSAKRGYNSLAVNLQVQNIVPTQIIAVPALGTLPTSPFGQWEIDVTGRFSFLSTPDNGLISAYVGLTIGGAEVNYGAFTSGSPNPNQGALSFVRTVQLASDGDATVAATLNIVCGGGTVLATDPETGYLCTELMLIARPL